VTVRAGASVVDITPGAGLVMGGYGARQGVSAGTRDALCARTLVLSDGAAIAVLSYCDLVGVGPDVLEEARRLIQSEGGIQPEAVAIGATHTHSGPGTLRIKDDAGYPHHVARKIAGSVLEAVAALEPVTLKLATAEVTQISQNRRDPDGPILTEATVLLAERGGGAPPVATLVNYACHATVLEYDNMLYSPDFPGAAARLIERNLGGVAMYMQGCAGDINPIWMRHDFEEVERVGGILGAAAIKAAHELAPLGRGQWAVNLSWSERTPKEPAPGTVLNDVSIAWERRTIDLQRRLLPPPSELEREIAELEARLDALEAGDIAGRRAIRPRLNEIRMERLRGRPAAPGETDAVEVSAIRLAPGCAIVTLPGEFDVEIGEDIRRACGLDHLLVSGYTNGYAGYFPKPKDFPEGGYEVGSARYEPEAADVVTDAALHALRSVR
jgi:hypothetical protein